MLGIWLQVVSIDYFMDLLEHVIGFSTSKALEQREGEGFPIELSVQQHIPRSLPSEPFTFRRVVGDGIVSQML